MASATSVTNLFSKFPSKSMRTFIQTALGVYGGMYVDDGTANTAIIDNGYTVVSDQSDTAMPTGGGVTVNTTNGSITVPIAGDYEARYHISSSTTGGNLTVHAAIHVNGVKTEAASNRKHSSANDIGAYSGGSLLTLNANAVLDVRAESSSNTNLEIDHIQFYLKLVG